MDLDEKTVQHIHSMGIRILWNMELKDVFACRLILVCLDYLRTEMMMTIHCRQTILLLSLERCCNRRTLPGAG